MFDDLKSLSITSPWSWFSKTLTDELPTTLNMCAWGIKTHFTFILILVKQSAILSPFVQPRLSTAVLGAEAWKGEATAAALPATGISPYLHPVKNCPISVDKTRRGLRNITYKHNLRCLGPHFSFFIIRQSLGELERKKAAPCNEMHLKRGKC